MPAPSGYFTGGIVEQVVLVKDKIFIRRKVIIEKPGADIDGGGEVDAVVPEIDQADPFGKREGGVRRVILQPNGVF